MSWKWFNWLFEKTRLLRITKRTKNRPHFISKNAWSYRKQGKLTPAMALYLNLGA